MAQVEIDCSDLPAIAAWGPPRDYAPTPGEEGYEQQGIKGHYWLLAMLIGLGLWAIIGFTLYAMLVRP
jgi:hypothetical protein